MANPGFGGFNPFANARPNRNPPVPPEQALGFGPNPFNRANRASRAAGINPPFVFNQETREPRWNARRDGQWGWNVNPQRRPDRVAAYDADQEYVRFQARALGLPQAQPQGPAVAPQPVNGANAPPPAPPAPPAPAQPAQPAQPAPQAPGVAPPPGNGAVPPPPAPGGEAQPGQNREAEPRVILLGRRGNAGTGREVAVPPMIAVYNLGLDLLGYVNTVFEAAVGVIHTIVLAVIEVAGPLVHFAAQWAIFFFFAAIAVWASMPTVLRVMMAVHKTIAVLLVALLLVLAWVFDVSINWPKDVVLGYTLRPEYTSRAVTGMAFLEQGVRPVEGGLQGPPYGATALSDADISMFTLPFPLTLPPFRTVWTIGWNLLIALVSAALWALGAALAIGLEIFPSEEDEGDREI